ncbi:MAG: lysophospholipid acyltransferase family protein, partial [Myxococcaceae bacterium]
MSKSLSTPASWLPTLVARCVIAWARWISPETRDALARGVGGFAFWLRIRRRVTLDNLRHAFPEKSEEERVRVARGAYENMARVFIEGLSTEALSDEELKARVEVDWDAVHRQLQAGKGLLVATAHMGGWELLGEAMARRGLPLSAVVRPLTGAFNAELMRSRRNSGLKLIAQRGAIAHVLQALKRNEVVAQLIDQALPAKTAVMVPFFGRPASTSPGISAAAMRSGAPVLVAVPIREAGRLRVRLEGPFAPPDTGDRREDMTQHMATLTAVLE